LKKRDQNRQAAQRYRMKKREERDSHMGELEDLQRRNFELRREAEDAEREIGYLKALMKELKR